MLRERSIHCWNDMRLLNKLCDATIKLDDGSSLPAHKCILAGASKYFYAVFTSPLNRQSDEQPTAITRVPWVERDVMEELLNFLYKKELTLTQENMYKLYIVCDYLCIEPAINECIRYFEDNFDKLNCIEILFFARNYHVLPVVRSAERFILKNFEDVSVNNNTFLELSLDDLLLFISSKDLNVIDEGKVWDAVVRWISHNEEWRKKHTPVLLKEIKLGLLSESYFNEHIVQHPYVQECYTKCQHLIQEVHEFMNEYQNLQTVNRPVVTPLFAQPRIPHDLLLAVGGWSLGAASAVIECYDSKADRWTQPERLMQGAMPRAYHGCATLNNRLYVIGGFDGIEYFNSCRYYDFDTSSWHEMSPMYHKRCYVSVTVLDGWIYALGGYDGHHRQNNAERYDPVTNQWYLLPNMNMARSDADATSLDGCVYIVGGFNGLECLNTAEVYNPEVNEWSMLPPMLGRKSGLSCIAHQGFIYAIGGFDGSVRLRSGERYNVQTETWTNIPDMISCRSNFAIEVIENVIMVFGGFNGIGTTHYAECFDPETNEWRHASDMTVNRSALAACVIRDVQNVNGLVYKNRELLLEEKRQAIVAIINDRSIQSA